MSIAFPSDAVLRRLPGSYSCITDELRMAFGPPIGVKIGEFRRSWPSSSYRLRDPYSLSETRVRGKLAQENGSQYARRIIRPTCCTRWSDLCVAIYREFRSSCSFALQSAAPSLPIGLSTEVQFCGIEWIIDGAMPRVADSGWFTAQLHMISNLILPGSTGQGWGTLAGHTAKADEIVLIPLNE